MLSLTWDQTSCRMDASRCQLYGETSTASSLATDMENLKNNLDDLIFDYENEGQVSKGYRMSM